MAAVAEDECKWRSKFVPVLAWMMYDLTFTPCFLHLYTLFSSSTAIILSLALYLPHTLTLPDINKKAPGDLTKPTSETLQ